MKNIKDNKVVIKHFRVTSEDNKKLERLARDGGFVSVSDFIRFQLGLKNA